MRTILYLVILSICSFNCYNAENPELNCDALIKIDSLEFSNNYTYPSKYTQKPDLSKLNSIITVEGVKSPFKDNLSDDGFIEFSVIGKYNKWNLIKGQGLNQNYYYLVKNNTIDTLIGYPKFYTNTILSIEEPYTDFQEHIEIWEIDTNENLILKNSFSLNKCYSFRIMDSYIINNTLFLRTGLEYGGQSFYKIRFR
jgi:hypothetical protein